MDIINMGQKILYHKDKTISIFEKGFKKSSSYYLPGIYDVALDNQMRLVIQYEENTEFMDPIKSSELENFEEYLKLFLENKEEFTKYNIVKKTGLLLYGEPGTMKTSYCKYLINKLITENQAIVVKGTSFYAIESFYEYVRTNSADSLVVILVDELDSFIDQMGSRDILEFMDGIVDINNVVFLATTNQFDDLPDSFKRPSRFKFIIEARPLSKTSDCEKLIENMGIDKSLVNAKDLADKTIDEASEVIKDYLIGFRKLKKSKNKIGFGQ